MRATILCAAIVSLRLASGCMATHETDASSAVKDAPDPDEQNSARLGLGPLTADDVRSVIHKGLAQKLAPAEIGDLESFKMSVIKLSKGADDVSGDPTEQPDGLEVQVTGWYKRAGGGEDAKAQCLSFDALVMVKKTTGDWAFPDPATVTLAREDQEDCY